MNDEEIIARLEGMKGNGYKEQKQAIDEAIEIIKSYSCEGKSLRITKIKEVKESDGGRICMTVHFTL